jgi:hypothetical protein
MPQLVQDQNPVTFDSDYDGAGGVFLLYSSAALPPSEPHVQIDLILLHQTKLKINDFVEDTTNQVVYAHRVLSTGALTAWTRVTGAVESPTFTFSVAPLDDEIDQFDVMVKPVPEGGSAPTYTTQQDAEQAGAGRVRVKIIKRGSRPDGLVARR